METKENKIQKKQKMSKGMNKAVQRIGNPNGQ